MEQITDKLVLMEALFGANGLITCSNIMSFDECSAQLQSNDLLTECSSCFFRLCYSSNLFIYVAKCAIGQQSLDQ